MGKVNKDNIKKALDSFEKDDFITAKDILKGEIQAHVSNYFKDKLELQKDLVEPPKVDNDGGAE